jgi:hypothetical protein
MLEFKRSMGMRTAESTCVFSGSRGEVCHIEPLKFEKFSESIVEKLQKNNDSARSSITKKNLDNADILFGKYSMLAMVSFTKIFVVTLRPKLTVLFTYSLIGNARYLPICSWQFVIMQPKNSTNNTKRYMTPVLACARESTIHFFQIDYAKNDKILENSEKSASSNDSQQDYDFMFLLLKKTEYKFKIYNFCWMNAKTLAILDNTEKVHIVDVKTDEILQVLSNLTDSVQLVYNNSFFKSLSTGGYVSKALAYAGENSCYQTFQAYSGSFFMQGKKSIHKFTIQTWSERIDDFVNDNNLDLALDLALSIFKGMIICIFSS